MCYPYPSPNPNPALWPGLLGPGHLRRLPAATTSSTRHGLLEALALLFNPTPILTIQPRP